MSAPEKPSDRPEEAAVPDRLRDPASAGEVPAETVSGGGTRRELEPGQARHELKSTEAELGALAAELERRVEERTTHLRLLQDVTTIANTEPDEDEAVRRTLARIAEYDGWTVGHLYRVGEDGRLEPGRIWYVAEGWEEATAELRGVMAGTAIERGRGLAGRVFEEAAPRWLVEGDDVDDPRLEALERTGLQGALAFPVMIGDEVAAVLEFFARHRIAPSPELLEVMGNIGVQLGRVMERSRARRRLSELALEEQRRVGEELHEGLGQQIAGLAMMARSLRRRLEEEDGGDPARWVELAREIEAGVENSREQVRGLSRGLVALQLEDRSLVEALDEMTGDLCEVYGTRCRLEADDELAVDDPRTVTCLYRIAREAVNNALLHARAGEVVIRLFRKGEELVLEVEDDGEGLPEDTGHLIRRGRGLGLGIMEERARMADGRLEIDSAPGRGTLVRCTVPGGDHG